MVPTHTLFGIMAALLEREETGRGQTVTVSQLEAAISMTPTAPMAYAANREIQPPVGCGDPDAAPHGVYRTLGYRRWIAIAVFSDDEWNALKRVMGSPPWAEDARFVTLEARQRNSVELDAHVESWTERQYADWLMETLTGCGVRAGVVKDAREVVEDPHLRRRRFWSYLDHPVVGSTLYNRAPIVFSRTPLIMETPAPLIGQHTKEVLTGMLGYTEAEVERMIGEEILV